MGSIREDLGEGFKSGVEFVKDAFRIGVKETVVKGRSSNSGAVHGTRRKTKSIGKKRVAKNGRR